MLLNILDLIKIKLRDKFGYPLLRIQLLVIVTYLIFKCHFFSIRFLFGKPFSSDVEYIRDARLAYLHPVTICFHMASNGRLKKI